VFSSVFAVDIAWPGWYNEASAIVQKDKQAKCRTQTFDLSGGSLAKGQTEGPPGFQLLRSKLHLQLIEIYPDRGWKQQSLECVSKMPEAQLAGNSVAVTASLPAFLR
jgi:hypothetical protein